MEHEKLMNIKRDESPFLLITSDWEMKLTDEEHFYLDDAAIKNKVLFFFLLILRSIILDNGLPLPCARTDIPCHWKSSSRIRLSLEGTANGWLLLTFEAYNVLFQESSFLETKHF